MIRLFPPAVLVTLVVTCCAPALAADAPSDVPECAKHLAEPAPGQLMSTDQLDANNACLFAMQQAKAASDLRKSILDNDHGPRENASQDIAAGHGQGEFPPGTPLMSVNKPVPSDASAPLPPPPPTIDTIMVDGGRATAGLRFADGNTEEVTKGSQLPDGSVIVAIGQHGVLVRHDGATRPLQLTGDAPSARPAAVSH